MEIIEDHIHQWKPHLQDARGRVLACANQPCDEFVMIPYKNPEAKLESFFIDRNFAVAA
jgi:hypothetical protein